MENTPKISCPKCSSESIAANKKGYSAGKAAAGVVLTGGIGLAAGAIGSNKIINTCMNCGHQWRPGQTDEPKKKFHATSGSRRLNKIVLIVFLAIVTVIVLICCL